MSDATVKVEIKGTGGGGYKRVITAPVPTIADLNQPFESDIFGGPLFDWWQDNVFPETGSGHGGHDFCEAMIIDGPTVLMGRRTTWEG